MHSTTNPKMGIVKLKSIRAKIQYPQDVQLDLVLQWRIQDIEDTGGPLF